MTADNARLPQIPVLDAQQATLWDAAAREAGSPSRVLMESAGRAAAHLVTRQLGSECIHRTIVVAGHGNNGGDGWVLARALHAIGAAVWVAEYEKERSPDCTTNRELALRDGVSTVPPGGEWPRAGLVVDALLGTGASGPPRGVVGDLAAKVMQMGTPVIAIDGPTGLDLTTGEAHGPVRADLTVTFGGVRRGHLLARDWCGRILIVDIGFGPCPLDSNWPLLVSDAWASRSLPPFQASMHKGGRGRVVIIGGEDGMAGAVQYAARAAFAAGAGLVRVATQSGTAAAMQENLPDVTVAQTALAQEVETDIDELLEWADSVVLGPGFGRGDQRTDFVGKVLDRIACPIVLDADALHVGADVLTRGNAPRVLTPHLGEFRAAFPNVECVQHDRFAAVRDAAGMMSGSSVVLLKGVPTVIGQGTAVRVVASGNPGLATGGSGDVLSGLIGAFLARGLSVIDAAALGAQALGRCAELVGERKSVRAMRPNDVVDMFPTLWEIWHGRPVLNPPVLLDLPQPRVE